MNLFESFDEIVNDEFIEKFKAYSHEKQGDFKVATKGVFYTLLAGIIRKSYSDMTAGMLFKQIKSNAQRIQLPVNLASIFSNDDVFRKIQEDGSKIISQIYPAYKSPLLSLIGSYAGTSKTVTATATNIVAVVIVSLFKKEDLTQDEMVTILRENHEPLFNEIPESLMEKIIPTLGLHDLTTIKPYIPKKAKVDAAIPGKAKEELSTEKVEYSNSTTESSSFKEWLIWILLAVVLLAGGVYYYLSQNGKLNFGDKVPVESVDTALPEVSADSLSLDSAVTAEPVLTDFSKFKEYVLNTTELAGKEFDFKSIKFVSDSTSLQKESLSTLDSIATLMKSHTRLQLKISAFSGSGETSFNNKRAFAVKKVLISKGIDGIKIDAVSGGLGEDFAKIKVVSK